MSEKSSFLNDSTYCPSAVTNLEEIIKIKFPPGATYLGGGDSTQTLRLRLLDQVDEVEGLEVVVVGDGRQVGREEECVVRVEGGHNKTRVERDPHLES